MTQVDCVDVGSMFVVVTVIVAAGDDVNVDDAKVDTAADVVVVGGSTVVVVVVVAVPDLIVATSTVVVAADVEVGFAVDVVVAIVVAVDDNNTVEVVTPTIEATFDSTKTLLSVSMYSCGTNDGGLTVGRCDIVGTICSIDSLRAKCRAIDRRVWPLTNKSLGSSRRCIRCHSSISSQTPSSPSKCGILRCRIRFEMSPQPGYFRQY